MRLTDEGYHAIIFLFISRFNSDYEPASRPPPPGVGGAHYLPSLGISSSSFFLAQNHAPRKSYGSMPVDLLTLLRNLVDVLDLAT